MLPLLHALFAGGWIGCVLVEALFERAMLGKGRDQELILARLHWKVDLLVEGPLLAAVAVTGIMLWPDRPVSALFTIKLMMAAIAISANLWCIELVRRRLLHAEAGRWQQFDRIDLLQHRIGAVVLVSLLATVALATRS